jgi:hypothetical protein
MIATDSTVEMVAFYVNGKWETSVRGQTMRLGLLAFRRVTNARLRVDADLRSGRQSSPQCPRRL